MGSGEVIYVGLCPSAGKKCWQIMQNDIINKNMSLIKESRGRLPTLILNISISIPLKT